MRTKGRVFISHASADKSFVDRLVADLRSNTIPVWYDKFDLKLGDSIPGSINEGISNSKYFAIVLTNCSLSSKWVQEELNAATMRQVTAGGTFILPLLLEDCQLPPLLAHRRHADFRGDYDSGLAELLGVWAEEDEACKIADKDAVHPWPDLDRPDDEFLYLSSQRFGKFFRMSCSLDWTVSELIDYVASTLKLPWNIDRAEIGMRWSFSYGLSANGEKLTLGNTLRGSGLVPGNVVQLVINGSYIDLYEKELKEAFSPDKIYLQSIDLARRQNWLEIQVAQRRRLTRAELREIANSCFSHV